MVKNMLTKLPGMFAFAIWDEANQTLFCGRDRFGEKPFYYAFGAGGEFIFASEIKAILASDLITPILDRQALAHYLQRMYVHPHQTIYSNIFTLPPAHRLQLIGGRVELERYWELPQLNEQVELREAEEEFRRLLDAAVAKQLIADVPVGAFLSGGLDSSTIVAYASRHKSPIQTFSFGFEQGFDELPFARDVANLYQTDHTELLDGKISVGELLCTMQQVYDEPFADTSNIPTYLISKKASQHIKVVLTGDGGDELLAGYTSWYQPLRQMEQMTSTRLLFYRSLFRMTRYSSWLYGQFSPVLNEVLPGVRLSRDYASIAQAHGETQKRFTDAELAALGLNAYQRDTLSYRTYHSNTVDDALRMDIEGWMPGDILVKIDRASMAHGLELRAPFLDVDFATFCISLPSCLKITGNADKYLLRQACANLWPPSLQNRPKIGFGVPFHDWFTRQSVKLLVNEYLVDRRRKIHQILNHDVVQNAAAKSDLQTWILLTLSMWMETHHFEMEN
jgi:asparagine synthase (glutamine-hydrolysing)